MFRFCGGLLIAGFSFCLFVFDLGWLGSLWLFGWVVLLCLVFSTYTGFGLVCAGIWWVFDLGVCFVILLGLLFCDSIMFVGCFIAGLLDLTLLVLVFLLRWLWFGVSRDFDVDWCWWDFLLGLEVCLFAFDCYYCGRCGGIWRFVGFWLRFDGLAFCIKGGFVLGVGLVELVLVGFLVCLFGLLCVWCDFGCVFGFDVACLGL